MTILYLAANSENPSQRRKLAGMRRYAGLVGAEVLPVSRAESVPDNLPPLLRRHRPAGCVADGAGCFADLPPGLFGRVPVVYVGYPLGFTKGAPSFHFDPDAIARTAFGELSAGRPAAYAAIGFPRPWEWSIRRVSAFRKVVREAGEKCHVFPSPPGTAPNPSESFSARLADWLATLPAHSAVFAVSDEVAAIAVRAAQTALRHIPKSLTLCSVDNFVDICESAPTPITSIQLDFERLGFMAAKALGQAITGCADARPKPVVIGPLMVVRRKSTSGRGRHEPWIMEAVEEIRREACDGLTAKRLIERYPQSRRNFERRFREAVGHSVLDEILHVRLEAVCALLARSGTPIGAISAMCGFPSDDALDALFRRRFGIGMRDWRRRNAYS